MSTAFEPRCAHCLDSLIAETLYGFDPCKPCCGRPPATPVSSKLLETFNLLSRRPIPLDANAVRLARRLVYSTLENPTRSDDLCAVLKLTERQLRDAAKELRMNWKLQLAANLGRPSGYYFCRTLGEWRDYLRVSRMRFVDGLATLYRVDKAVTPELAGQTSFDFCKSVAQELQEIIG